MNSGPIVPFLITARLSSVRLPKKLLRELDGTEVVSKVIERGIKAFGGNMGAALSPMNAFLILQGIETLPLRMDRICHNARRIAHHLKAHPKVRWVNYAGLPEHPDHALAEKYLGGRASGIVSFGIEGGRDAGARFQDALQLFTRLVNIGDAKSLACHPASTTHRQLGPEELARAGVSVDMVRLSVGIEHIDDLVEDIDRALAAA